MLKRRLISTVNIRDEFTIEFFAFNISISEITKKIYIKLLSDVKDVKKVVLSDKQLQLISSALDNKYLSSFCSNRYYLFDISLRESNDTSNVGFSFNDVCDYTFIDPLQIFEPFVEFGIDNFINTTKVVQKAIFQQKPHYNPIFMIGMVMDKSTLKSVKAYIRYDLAEAPTSFERENIIKAISTAINPKINCTSFFFDVAEKLENLGFVFSFIGIDGCVSSLIGASLINPNRLCFGVVGDLTFFYDLNSLGNHHIGKNLRLMLINNGVGAEFRLSIHPCSAFGEDANRYMAAGGHFGNKSHELVKHYAEDLGFHYLSANSKEEFLEALKEFASPELSGKSMILEVFTRHEDESEALARMSNIEVDAVVKAKASLKNAVKGMLGENAVGRIKKVLK